MYFNKGACALSAMWPIIVRVMRSPYIHIIHRTLGIHVHCGSITLHTEISRVHEFILISFLYMVVLVRGIATERVCVLYAYLQLAHIHISNHIQHPPSLLLYEYIFAYEVKGVEIENICISYANGMGEYIFVYVCCISSVSFPSVRTQHIDWRMCGNVYNIFMF